MLFKLLVFGLAIFGAYVLLKNKLGSNESKKENAQNMLECEECGAYFIKSDGVRFGGKIYCSKECKDKARG
ncbi:MAG: PP0621 family protein [Sulfurovaceae bacterium]|nr:PP0621 family protein [Sulfurovaceae bacterium]MDD5549315.1 PP0621 family protein [Sulfurovaceae bacterium]